MCQDILMVIPQKGKQRSIGQGWLLTAADILVDIYSVI